MQRIALVKIIGRGSALITHDLLTNKVASTVRHVAREHLSSIDIPEFMKREGVYANDKLSKFN